MICKCPYCGEKYERFTLGDYASPEDHKCKEILKDVRVSYIPEYKIKLESKR